MIRFKASRMSLAVGLAVAVILAAGGMTIASNMGFKLNKPIVSGALTGPNDNWTSLPYFNPYSSFGGFCNQTGLKTTIGSQAQITKIDPTTNLPTSANCGTATANNVPLPGSAGTGQFAGVGIRIKQPVSTGAPTSIIIVGSHDPAERVNIPSFCNTNVASANCALNANCTGAGAPAACCTGAGTGTCGANGLCTAAGTPFACCTGAFAGTCTGSPASGKGRFWFSVPYHTTAVTIKDLCLSMGLPSLVTSTATVSRIDATTGNPQSSTCFASTATGINLVLGEAVQITSPVPVNNIVPAHY